MPIASHIDKAKDLTIFTVTGVFAFGEMLIVVDAFYEGNPTKHVLWNLNETTDVLLTPEEVERIITYQPRFDGKREAGKTAFVAQDAALFEIARMFEIKSESIQAPYPIMAFRSKDEASQWLDEPVTDFD